MELTRVILPAPFFIFGGENQNMQSYLDLLQQNLADEVEATRSYAATMAIAPKEDIPVLLELLADETDHIAQVATLIAKLTGQDVDYPAMIPGVDE